MPDPGIATIGLLPFFLSLYDESVPSLRQEMEPFGRLVAATFRDKGFAVHEASICCVQGEFEQALRVFETQRVDVIVTLHLAYSPSLESARLLAKTNMPLLILDITPDLDFGQTVDPNRILYDHGVHGVQDLCSMLRRYGKDFQIVAGHLSDPGVINRATGIVRAARAATGIKNLRTLRIGPVFAGMGDFQVHPDRLRQMFGTHVDQIAPEALCDSVAAVEEETVEQEMSINRQMFEADLSDEVHRRSARLGLGLRRYLDEGHYDAFSMNFDSFRAADGPICTVPFLECCLAMARGVGYAGEGDILTALLVAALQCAYGLTSFTEIFCPDWLGQTLFLSHMGEFNPQLSAGKARLYEKVFPFTPALNPAAIACAPEAGPATLVNLAPGPDDLFSLIICPVEILRDGSHPAIKDWLRAWIKPAIPLASFLEKYSRFGGTHHSALMLGEHCESLKAFAVMTGLDGVVIG